MAWRPKDPRVNRARWKVIRKIELSKEAEARALRRRFKVKYIPDKDKPRNGTSANVTNGPFYGLALAEGDPWD